MTEPIRPSYDLTREPWIPCEALDGSRVDLGFEEVLLRAHELAGVHDESPLATAVIHRLLLAILHRVVDGPHSVREWRTFWETPRLDEARIRAYFDRWRHRFDLFDAERPFMQVPRLGDVLRKEREGKELKVIPARRLALERSFYAGASRLLEHGGDEAPLPAAEAARAMLGFQGFGPGGRIFNDSGHPKFCPLRAGAVILARGNTLRATLGLNLLLPSKGVPPATTDDATAWERSAPAVRGKRAVAGWLDALTWQSRRVELVPDDRGSSPSVSSVVTGVGEESIGEWLEPMHALVIRDPTRGAEPVRFDPDRTVWRDATALFQGAGVTDGHRRPAVCSQMAVLVEEDILERTDVFALDVYGLASSQASAAIELWRAERMPLPISLLGNPELLDVVRAGLAASEAIEGALRRAVWSLARYALAPGDRSPDKKDIRALANRMDARSRYWAVLGRRFDVFLQSVGGDDPEGALAEWKNVALRVARRALTDASAQLGTQGRALQACAIAERHLSRELAELAASTIEGAHA